MKCGHGYAWGSCHHRDCEGVWTPRGQPLPEPTPEIVLPARIGVDWNTVPLGARPDADIASDLGVSREAVTQARNARDIPSHREMINTLRDQRRPPRRKTMRGDRLGTRKVSTTVYLRVDQKAMLEVLSAKTGRPEAEILRECLDIGMGLNGHAKAVKSLPNVDEKPVHIR